jgi:hypothetical protein
LKAVFKYRSTSQALLAVKQQVIDSMPAAERLNITGTPEVIFYELKNKLQYVPDPSGRELLQQLDTLLNLNGNNFHQMAGAGDCDCFTIAALAVLINAGYSDFQVIIAGRSKQAPVHIWCRVAENDSKKWYNFDLTEKTFDNYRYYRFHQKLNFTI